MITYQDLVEAREKNESMVNFVLAAINEHKNSDEYKQAVVARDYYRGENTTIAQYEKTVRTITGQEVPDRWSPNHKTKRNFFKYFLTQETQFLLGNGITWGDPATDNKVGDDFDTILQDGVRYARMQGVSFGFWNYDHVEFFKLEEFKPLYDERTSALRAGVRFWQIDQTKPLRATLYEEDGFTEYIWDYRDNQNTEGQILVDKQSYVQTVRVSEADGLAIVDGENYDGFPIIPLYGSKEHTGLLGGLRDQIDAYDLIKNGFLNDLDTAKIYWTLQGTGGADDVDLVQFLERLHILHVANLEPGQTATPTTVQVPSESNEAMLNRLERDLFKDAMAFDPATVSNGAVTATQIQAAYEPLNLKCDEIEYCIHQFLKRLLQIAGVEDEATFTRSIMINVSENIQCVIQAGQYLPEDYVTRKILELLGDGDLADELLKQMSADEMERITLPEEQPEEEQKEPLPFEEEPQE